MRRVSVLDSNIYQHLLGHGPLSTEEIVAWVGTVIAANEWQVRDSIQRLLVSDYLRPVQTKSGEKWTSVQQKDQKFYWNESDIIYHPPGGGAR